MKSRSLRRGGEFDTRVWKKKNAHKFLMGKREGRRHLGKLRRRWEFNKRNLIFGV
jgi:hypothetical protein